MVENIVNQDNVMELVVKFVLLVILIEKNQLKLRKLKYENFRNRKCNCRCYLQSRR